MSKYLGTALRCARYETKIGTKRLAGYIGITENELRRFEHGRHLIDARILTKLLAAGIRELELKNAQ